MATLLTLVLSGILVAYFATQNTGDVSINLLGYSLVGIPIYFLVLGSVLLGLLMGSIINLIDSLFSSLKLRDKNHTINEVSKKALTLEERIHELEVENARLKGKGEPIIIEPRSEVTRDSWVNRLRHKLAS